jgi:dipeptidyl aminopeptidase/acylaminoacyl peptidase
MRIFLTFLVLFTVLQQSNAQKRALEHADVHRWRKVEQVQLSTDGQWAIWVQAAVTEGDPVLYLRDNRTKNTRTFARSTDAKISADNKWLLFRTKPALDSLKSLRRRKVKDDDLPKDTLGILNLETGQLEQIPRLRNFTVPEKWDAWIAYQYEAAPTPKPAAKDTSKINRDTAKVREKPAVASKKAKKPKKEDKENGYRLVIRNTRSGLSDTIAYVTQYALAKRSRKLLIQTTGQGDTLTFSANKSALQAGVYWVDLDRNTLRPLYRGKGKFQHLTVDEIGGRVAFLGDVDTTKARIRPWQLYYWDHDLDSAVVVADAAKIAALDPKVFQQFGVSEHYRPVFSENSERLYFGMAPPPILNDTTLLNEEIVQVEVWAWNEKRLYTEQEIRLEADKKRAYPAIFYTSNNQLIAVGTPEIPEIRFQEERNADIALGFTEEPYAERASWEGKSHKDVYAIDLNTGFKKLIAKHLRGNPRLSPSAKYIYWWSEPDTAWMAWNRKVGTIVRLTNNRLVSFFDEQNDVPDYPDPHGVAGWTEDDDALLVYDRYDLWQLDPTGQKQPERLTQGRESERTYRYLRLDPEERSIPKNAQLLLHQVHRRDKGEGYAWLDLKKGKLQDWLGSKEAALRAYSRQPVKAKNAATLLTTLEDYAHFPDLYCTQIPEKGNSSMSIEQISQANPQQMEYKWGSMRMTNWTSLTGESLEGLLVVPDDFDPQKKYPLIVNFYERSSDDLLRHRHPDFHRSQINYTFYASRGYVVFSPDIPYKTGYPGESAYDAIVSGVTALINRGFIDSKRVALQGHSWGGYQTAYLVTRTNLFRCAEAGAPVANMTSAYGGIRWESGLHRAFQYEHQQSRIGGSLWEYPLRFLENSPLFSLDKVQTPLLILHNDKDGAVPWYQGIELYTGLRRLGKPTWLLNYNDEPHWPVKLQNRADFQRRMQQFFDHYLMDAPEPRWMQRGVPPIEKGIEQGF